MAKKTGPVRKANRRAAKMAEGLHGKPIPVSAQVQEQLTGVVNGIEISRPAPLDVALVGRAVKERWPVDASKRPAIVNRLMQIVEKTTVSILTKGGKVVEVESSADTNAIAAVRTLVAMEGQNQNDEHHVDKQSKPSVPGVNPFGIGTAVQVNVDMNGVETIQGPSNDPETHQELKRLEKAVNDPEFVEFRRRRALGRDTQPGSSSQMGIKGSVESSRSSNGNGSSSPGTHNGSVNGEGNHH